MIRLKNHRVYRSNNFDPSEDEYKEEEIDEVISFLTEYVTVDGEFTFGDLLNFLQNEWELYSGIFHSSLGGYPLQDYIDEVNSNEEQDIDIDRLEVFKVFELWEFDDKYELESWVGFSGKSDLNNEESYSVSLINLGTLKNIPIEINNRVRAFNWGNHNTVEEMFEAEYKITVFEFLHAILNDISFYGSFEEKEKVKNELHDRYQEAIDSIESGNYTSFKTLDELFDDLEIDE